jgi:DNA-binding SARP family transcriptional activator
MSRVEDRLRFQVLGPLMVVLDGAPIPLGSPVQRRVLAALLLRRNETVSRSALIAEVWSADAEVFEAWELEERKRGALFTYIARLRGVLEPVAAVMGESALLFTEDNGYRLAVADKYVDETEFRNLVLLGHAALEAGQPAAAAQHLAVALEMWHGEPLGDLSTEPFARENTARLNGVRLGALEAWADSQLLLHRHRDLVAEAGLRRWVLEYPSSERLRRAFAVALHRSGRTAAAVSACRDGIDHLALSGTTSSSLEQLLDELTAPAAAGAVSRVSTAPAPPSADALEEAAEELSRVVRWQWQAEVAVRQLPDPHPIPVRWLRSDRGDAPAEGRGDVLRTDAIESVATAFQALQRRRLVVLGPAGSGKSTLAMMLTVELATRRRPDEPVPVLLSLASWRAAEEHLHTWLRRRLAEEYPVLLDAGRFGGSAIADLVADRRILPILDGLDELPARQRSVALRALNHSLLATDSVVLTSRPAEYEAAAADGQALASATTIQAQPVRVQDAVGYLRDSAGPGRAERWTPVFTELANQADGPLATALTSPLALMMTRIVYGGPLDPAELAGAGRFSDRTAVEGHLLDLLVPTLVEQDGHRQARSRLGGWDAAAFQDWLVYLARLTRRQGTYSIMWWRLPEAVGPLAGRTGRSTVAAVLVLLLGLVLAAPTALPEYGVAAGLLICLKHGLAYGLGTLAAGLCTDPGPPAGAAGRDRARRVLTGALRTGLAGGAALGIVEGIGKAIQAGAGQGLITGTAYGLGMSVAFGMGSVITAVPSPTTTDLRLRLRGRALLRMLGRGLAAGAAVGLTIGAASQAALMIVRRGGVVVEADLVVGLLPGLAFGLVAGVASAFIHWSRQPVIVEQAHSLRSTLVADRRQYLALLAMVTATIMVAFTLGAVISVEADLASNVRHGIRNGLAGSVVLAVAFGFTAAWPLYQMARIWLALRRRLPWRFVAFLEEAQRIGVLRRVGATYEFRHATLRDQLAARAGTAE